MSHPTSQTASLLERGKAAVIGNYARLPIVMDHGQGSHVFDTDGKRYIDLFAGFGGAILGHCHPDLIRAVNEQASKLWHVGNTFWTEPQIELAERLNRVAFRGQAFFCHSGLEANEAACKLARLRGQESRPGRWKILSLHRSFHGRSLAMISATGNSAVKAGFGPEVPGFVNVAPGDIDALESAIDDETCGVIMEPIQGEGGINEYPPEYPAKVRDLCDERGLTLIFDEVWTGGGRTGKWFGYQHFCRNAGKKNNGLSATGSTGSCQVEPDIMTLGKAVGGGLPVGIMYAKPDLAAKLVPGKHGCTLGGNPICMAAARTVFDVIERDGLLAHATQLGAHAVRRFKDERRLKDKIESIRGQGLFLGIELKSPPTGIVEKALERGVVMNLTAQKVIRLAPPLNISEADWDEGLSRAIDTIAAD